MLSLAIAAFLFLSNSAKPPEQISMLLLPPVPVRVQPATPPAVNMASRWGFKRENAYNEKIVKAVKSSWTDPARPLPPRLFKALIAQESAFRPDACSWAGAVGLTQLMPEAASRLGLRLHDRTNPDLAIPAGVCVLEEKHRVVMDPVNYWSYLGQPGRMESWNVKVGQAYKQWGEPEGKDRYYLMLGAYNGGGSTVLRAMAKAHDRRLDPRKWGNLIAGKRNSPLYLACVEVYGQGAWGKYQEMSDYPGKIYRYYQN